MSRRRICSLPRIVLALAITSLAGSAFVFVDLWPEPPEPYIGDYCGMGPLTRRQRDLAQRQSHAKLDWAEPFEHPPLPTEAQQRLYSSSQGSSTPLAKAFFILLHGGLEEMNQFGALWRRIHSPESFYAVHLTADSPPEGHNALRDLVHPQGSVKKSQKNVKILTPRCVTWGGPASAKVTLQAIRLLLYLGPWSHFLLLSGTHYPVRPPAYIDSVLRSSRGVSFLPGSLQNRSHWQYPKECSMQFTEDVSGRYLCRFVDDCKKGKKRFDEGARAVSVLGERRDAFKTMRDLGIEIYSGTQWVILSREAAEYCGQSPTVRRLYKKLFRQVGVADESFFHTAIRNHPKLGARIDTNFTTRVYWGSDRDDLCWVKPCRICSNNIERVVRDLESPEYWSVLFARKFDWADKVTYEWVDRVLLNVTREPPRRSGSSKLPPSSL